MNELNGVSKEPKHSTINNCLDSLDYEISLLGNLIDKIEGSEKGNPRGTL